MNPLEQWRRRKAKRKPGVLPPPPAPIRAAGTNGWLHERRAWFVAAAVLIFVLSVSYRIWVTYIADGPHTPVAELTPPKDRAIVDLNDAFDRTKKKVGNGEPNKKDADSSFLEDFGAKDSDEKESKTILTNAELEEHFKELTSLYGQIEELKRRASEPGALDDNKAFAQAMATVERLNDQYNAQAKFMDVALQKAKKARPEDPVLHWLAGEVLLLIGGESDTIASLLQFAVAKGVQRPRLAASVALNQLKANQFGQAYTSAAAAVDQPGADRYVWNAFIKIGFSDNRFADVAKRLDRAFPDGLPSWARRHRKSADELQALWQTEEKLRSAEAKADDLPRVRLVIEHRRFAKDKNGQPLTTIESTSREEIVLELFENEAPNTVANFLDLVAQKFYDGTSFHHAVPADMAAGGDPNTKNDDPADDGKGGPGYVLPNEFTSPKARKHFRGSISMYVDEKKRTSGSLFLLSLVPDPELNGENTVFGRIIQGQEAADRITQGQTYRKKNESGKLIPGDLLVRAEIVRKRGHEYKVVKEQP